MWGVSKDIYIYIYIEMMATPLISQIIDLNIILYLIFLTPHTKIIKQKINAGYVNRRYLCVCVCVFICVTFLSPSLLVLEYNSSSIEYFILYFILIIDQVKH